MGTPNRSLHAGLRTVGPPFAAVACVLVLWQWLASASFAPPTAVAHALWRTRSLIVSNLWTTLGETALGVGFGVVVGIGLAAVIATIPPVRRALAPLLIVSQTVPLQILGPLLVLVFGFGWTPRVVIVALIVFFPMLVATVTGIESAEGEYLDLVRSFGASRADVVRLVLVPTALPSALAGLRISLTYAIAGAVIAEGVGAESGLGLYIARSQHSYRSDQVLAGVVVVALLSLLLYATVSGLERLLCPWRTKKNAGTFA